MTNPDLKFPLGVLLSPLSVGNARNKRAHNVCMRLLNACTSLAGRNDITNAYHNEDINTEL